MNRTNKKQLKTDHSDQQKTLVATQAPHNALLTDALGVLSQSSHIRQNYTKATQASIEQQSIQGINVFIHSGNQQGYSTPTLLSARYLLAATLDEIIATADGQVKDASAIPYTILRHFQQEESDSARFFLILKRACDTPDQHIDLIELAYHCLSIGFMGNYRFSPNGHQVLSELLDKTYQIIKETRGEPCLSLSIGDAPHLPESSTSQTLRKRPKRTFLIWGGCLLLCAAVVAPYWIKLNTLIQPITQAVSQLQSISSKDTVS